MSDTNSLLKSKSNNKEDKKDKWIDIAEIADALRIVPRSILIAYGFLVYETVSWFMNLTDPSTQQVTLVSTVVGAAAVVIGLYNNSGRTYK